MGKIKIIRSYARKLPHESIGGARYEMSDFFSGYEFEGDESMEAKDIQDVSERLSTWAKRDIDNAVDEEIKEIKKAIYQKLNARLGKLTAQEQDQIEKIAKELGVDPQSIGPF